MNDMAKTCVATMKQEKAAMPYIIAGEVTFGTLLLVALVLLVVLEAQCITHWKRLLNAQNRDAGS